jgi:ABA4-like protein
MTPEQVFSIVNPLAAVGWIVLILFPRRKWATDVVIGVAIPALFAAAYVAIIVAKWGSSQGSFSSLQGVATLFANPWLLLAGWIHYLAFDLLTGRWEVMDARGRGIPHLVVVPCLLLTFLFGPAGWLLYTVVRFSVSRGERAPSL